MNSVFYTGRKWIVARNHLHDYVDQVGKFTCMFCGREFLKDPAKCQCPWAIEYGKLYGEKGAEFLKKYQKVFPVKVSNRKFHMFSCREDADRFKTDDAFREEIIKADKAEWEAIPRRLMKDCQKQYCLDHELEILERAAAVEDRAKRTEAFLDSLTDQQVIHVLAKVLQSTIEADEYEDSEVSPGVSALDLVRAILARQSPEN